jgi:hypothetical protein
MDFLPEEMTAEGAAAQYTHTDVNARVVHEKKIFNFLSLEDFFRGNEITWRDFARKILIFVCPG